jgi:hypothetical protein
MKSEGRRYINGLQKPLLTPFFCVSAGTVKDSGV